MKSQLQRCMLLSSSIRSSISLALAANAAAGLMPKITTMPIASAEKTNPKLILAIIRNLLPIVLGSTTPVMFSFDLTANLCGVFRAPRLERLDCQERLHELPSKAVLQEAFFHPVHFFQIMNLVWVQGPRGSLQVQP